MYYIYEIPNVKIGCTSDIKGRMRAQGFTDWIILEEYADAQTAGDRELELQKEKGYPVDKLHYTHSIAMLEIRRSKYNLTKEHFSNMGKKGGSRTGVLSTEQAKQNGQSGWAKCGQIAIDTGQLEKIRLANLIPQECPHCGKILKSKGALGMHIKGKHK